MKLILKKLLKKPSSTEIIILAVAIVVYLLLSGIYNKKTKPVGDFGPSPYETHKNAEPNEMGAK